MPIITSIKPQKNKKKVSVFLDEKLGFALDIETFLKLKLKEGQSLTEKEVEKIIESKEFSDVYNKLLKFSSLRPRSEKEILIWLKKHKVPIFLHQKLFNRLKYLNYVNDENFARWWINQRIEFRPKSKRQLKEELLLKGVSKEIIEKVLDELEVDEVALAKKIIDKKSYLWKNLKKDEAFKKKAYFLIKRGFDWEVIEKVIKN